MSADKCKHGVEYGEGCRDCEDDERHEGERSLAAPAGSAAAMANRIARAIMTSGGGVACNRIALKSGEWPDKEKDEGGWCFSALEQVILDTLQANGWKPPNDALSGGANNL